MPYGTLLIKTFLQLSLGIKDCWEKPAKHSTKDTFQPWNQHRTNNSKENKQVDKGTQNSIVAEENESQELYNTI